MKSETKGNFKKIVIVGGGFAGLNLAKKLAKDEHYDITLVDKNNYNFFPPLIYQVATSFLEPASISYPYRKLLRGKQHIHFRIGTLLKVSPLTRTCFLDNGEIAYDYLVVATGAAPNYFGNENIKCNAIPMKTLNDALKMRNRLLQTLEQACITKDVAERKKLLTVVVAGGGPTGVEVSGMLGELRRNIIEQEYPELKGVEGDIFLVDGGPKLLAQMSNRSHLDALGALTKLGIKVILNAQVTDFSNEVVRLSNGVSIETESLIWTAGVIADTFGGIPATSLGKGRRMLVDAFNKVQGVDDIYAIGDSCLMKADPYFPEGHPQLAQTAIQQGQRLAKNFALKARGKPLQPFLYNDKGTMAIIGRNMAVVDLTTPALHVKGLLALVMWLFVHLMSLLTYRNKMRTLYNWAVGYFTKDQSLRMIIRP